MFDRLNSYSRHAHRGACLLLALALAACGGSSQNLRQCGNGRIETGEQCDDGNRIDTDTCTSVCRNARCGDGAVQQGVEVCDGGNLGADPLTKTCGSFGFAIGTGQFAGCQASCADYDLSECGPAFTPTPVRPTATATATPTYTPTPMETTCGDGLLQPGETCESCPEDCQPAACTPSGAMVTFNVTITSSRKPSNVAVQLAYRSSVISIPGSGSDLSVRQRVRPAPPLPTSFMVNDLDYAVDIASGSSSGLPNNTAPFASARFDVCTPASGATVADLSCVVEHCTDAAGAIAGCACRVGSPP